MANEQILRNRWNAAFQDSPEYKKAQLAAEVSRQQRLAEFEARRRSARNAFDMARIQEEERAQEGTGPGEIQLKALEALHAGEVNKYINDARKDQQARSSLPSSVGETVPIDPDFSNHYPWIKPNFDVGESKDQMVNTARQRVIANGGTWTPADEMYGARATGSKRTFDAAAATLTAEAQNQANAAAVANKQHEQEYKQSVQDAQRAQMRLLFARMKGRQDVGFDPNRPSLGGTLTRNGQRYMSSPTGPVAFPSADSMPGDPRDQPADGSSDNDGHDSEGRAETEAEMKAYNEQVPRDTPQYPSFDQTPALSGYAAMSSPRFASPEAAGIAFDVVDNRFRPTAQPPRNSRFSYDH